MTSITDRYHEIVALLPDDVDLDEEVHGAPPEVYIMAAAEHLGFIEPALALDLETPLDELIEAFAKGS